MYSEGYVSLRGITKTFGRVVANDNVELTINKGEIHALLGENGSGKSTLMNMLSGIYMPDSGSIYIENKEVHFHSPNDSIAAGIGMVHQHFKLVEVLTAKENIVLGQKNEVFVKGKSLTEEINNIANKYGLKVNPDKKVYNMSVSEKQTVEILKVLYRGANVLILDEPTAVLTPQETKVLFDIIRNMKAQGCAIVIITHKLNEVMEISDKVTILRKGKSIKTVETKNSSPEELTEFMVGKSISLEIDRPTYEGEKNTILSIENLTVKNHDGINALNNVSFELKKGEILGVAGIAGSGQKELCEAIAGLEKVNSGKIMFKGENIVGMNPRNIIDKGISMSFIPEDRLGMGLVGGMDIVENVLLKSYRDSSGFFVDRKKGKELAEDIVKKFAISTPGIDQIVKRLSGGNIQKVLLGREIELNPELLITAYPVRGLDIGASYHIYSILNEQKMKGVGVLFIGEDLDVLLEISDRLMVMYNGEIMGIVDAKNITKEEVGLMMVGQSKQKEVNKDVSSC